MENIAEPDLTEAALIRAREQLGLTHVQAGERLHVDRSTFQRWERELPTRATSRIAIRHFINMAEAEVAAHAAVDPAPAVAEAAQ